MNYPLADARTDGLNRRSLEILRLLADGLTDREIAERLVMTVNTVKWYNRQIYSILHVGSRTQAIARARELHLLEVDTDSAGQPESVGKARHPRHNLPHETTRFIGRRRELDRIGQRLASVRLLTLVGAPGTGKTRLALQIAWGMVDRFAQGVYFVSLAPVSESSFVPNAIAGALGVSEVPGKPVLETLKQALGERELLLLLDNFEHLLPAAPVVSELLAAAPRLKVFVTSREPLHLYGEHEYRVPTLELPEPEQIDRSTLADCESVALFVQRAQAVQPDFALTVDTALDIAKICVRLEGLPLAIELAAARVKLFTPRMLLHRLGSRLDALTGGALDLAPRQQTLRNTIAWSYNLLDEGEKRLFARLGVFAGGWSLEAAEVVCGEDYSPDVVDGLTSLLDKNLIRKVGGSDDAPRFTMLETIGEYALECLSEHGEMEALRARHAAYFTLFAERTGNALYSRYRSDGLANLEAEQNNFRAALRWSLEGDPEPGLRLIAALGVCWRIRSYLVEGFTWAQRLLEVGTDVPPDVRANALSSSSRLLACYLGNHADAERMSSEALHLARTSGDQRSIASALYARGASLLDTRASEARGLFMEALALFHALDDQWGIAQTWNILGEVARLEGDDGAAEQLYEQALSLYRQIDNPWGVNIALQNLAYVAQHRGDYVRAKSLFAEALVNSHTFGDSLSIANSLAGLGGVVVMLDEPERAALMFGAAQALLQAVGAQIAPSDGAEYERNLLLVRARLDEQAFEAAWRAGQMLSLEQMLAAALQPEAV